MILSPEQARKLADALLVDGGDDGLEAEGPLDSVLGWGAQGGGEAGRVGRYRVVRLVGHGGMGEVYEAQQDHPSRRVALKVVRPDFVSPELVRRLDHEARILGRLQHPGIAQIYDAGQVETPRGPTPYFAMEFVEGRPLTAFAKAEDLGLRNRLKLFLAVCDAVEHAHRKGVIHRDLKPANILVDGEGKPRVLDFGVARATNADVRATTVHTEVGKLIGTLPSMSPEQGSGDADATDTRSDVYSLGVVLYELLAGQPPYDVGRGPIPEAARIIRDTDPARLSSIDRVFRGDLETIAAKALEKDKERRYQSVAALAADIRHHLNFEPIEARPVGFWYHTNKLARRHRILIGAAGAVLVTLTLATAVSVVFAIRAEGAREDAERAAAAAILHQGTAENEQKRAERQSEIARAVTEYLRRVLSAPDPSVSGKDARVVDVLRGAAQAISDDLQGQDEVAVVLRTTIAQTLGALGDLPAAEEQARLAYRHALTAFGESAPQTDAPLHVLGVVLFDRGNLEEAEAVLRQCLERGRGESGAEFAFAVSNSLADVLRSQGKLGEARELLSSTLPRSREVLGETNECTIRLMLSLGAILKDHAEYDGAEELLARAFTLSRDALGEHDPVTFSIITHRADVQVLRGRVAEAVDPLRALLADCRSVLGDNHPQTLTAMNNFADALRRTGRLDEAELLLREALERKTTLLGEEHESTLATMNNLANLLRRKGEVRAAMDLARRSYGVRLRVLGPDHRHTLTAAHNLALHLKDAGELEEAQDLFEQAARGREIVLGPAHHLTLSARLNLARLYRARGRNAESESELREVIRSAGGESEESRATYLDAHLELGLCLIEQERFPDAESALLLAREGWSARGAQGVRRLRRVDEALVTFYERLGDTAKAAEWRAKLAPDDPARAPPAPSLDPGG